MNREIEEIIRIIKEEYPDASEEEIKKAITDYIESHLPDILAEIDLPSQFSHADRYRRARFRIKIEMLGEERSKKELVAMLKEIQNGLRERGMIEDASRFRNHIGNIESASFTKKEVLRYSESDLSDIIVREETAEEDRTRAIRRLEDLSR